jgi:hypothetical protein
MAEGEEDVKGITPKEDPDPQPQAKPRQLPSGKWIGCRHWTDHGVVGFHSTKYVAHYHDYEETR